MNRCRQRPSKMKRSGWWGDHESRPAYAWSVESGHEGALERRLGRAVRSIEQWQQTCLHPVNPAVGAQGTTPIPGGGSTTSGRAVAGARALATALQPAPVKAMAGAPTGLVVALVVVVALPQRCWGRRRDCHRSKEYTQGQVWYSLRVKCGPSVFSAALLGMAASISMRSTQWRRATASAPHQRRWPPFKDQMMKMRRVKKRSL